MDRPSLDNKHNNSPSLRVTKPKFYNKILGKSNEALIPPPQDASDKGHNSVGDKKTSAPPPPKRVEHGASLPLGLKQGWLRTEISGLLGKSTKQSCWFVITPTFFECYTTKRETDPSEAPKWSLPLGLTSSISEHEGPSIKEPTFSIYCSVQKKRWLIETNNIEERNNWIHSIRCLVEVNRVDQNYKKLRSTILVTDEHWIQQELKKVIDYLDRVRRKVEDQAIEKALILKTYTQMTELLLGLLGCSKILLVNPASTPARETLSESADQMKEFLKDQTALFKKYNMGAEVKCAVDVLGGITKRISEPLIVTSPLGISGTRTLDEERNKNNNNNNNNNNTNEDEEEPKEEQGVDISKMLKAAQILGDSVKQIVALRSELGIKTEVAGQIPKYAKECVQALRDIRQGSDEVSTRTGYAGTDRPVKTLSELVVGLISSTKKALTVGHEESITNLKRDKKRIVDLLRDLVREANIAQQYELASTELLASTEAIKTMCGQLKEKSARFRQDEKLSRGINWETFESTLQAAGSIAEAIARLPGPLKVQSKQQLFQAIKGLSANINTFGMTATELSEATFTLIEELASSSQQRINIPEYVETIKNGAVQLLNRAKFLISSDFSSHTSSLEVAATSTTMAHSVSEVLSVLKADLLKIIELQTPAMTARKQAVWVDEPEDEDHIFKIVRDNEEHIMAATLNKLIQRLTSASNARQKYQKDFLLTYRSFTTPDELFELLSHRYNVRIPNLPPPLVEEYVKTYLQPIQFRVLNTIKTWLEMSQQDLSASLTTRMLQFVREKTAEKDPSLAKIANQLSTTLTNLTQSARRTKRATGFSQIMSLLVKDSPSEPLTVTPMQILFEFSEKDIAEQLTLLDSTLYAQIQPVEVMGQAWSKPHLKHLAPNVLHITQRFNEISSWAASMVLWKETAFDRAQVFCKLVTLISELRALNNFNSALAVQAGLSVQAVHRLKQTLSKVPPKVQETLDELMQLFSTARSYGLYREALRNCNPPVVPYLGVWLTDLTKIEEGNKDFNGKLINFRKRELVANVLNEIRLYQVPQFQVEPNRALITALSSIPRNSDDILYKMSLLREPREYNKDSHAYSSTDPTGETSTDHSDSEDVSDKEKQGPIAINSEDAGSSSKHSSQEKHGSGTEQSEVCPDPLN